MNGAADGESKIPELPDVPTQEPTEEGEPDAKKQKLEEGDEK